MNFRDANQDSGEAKYISKKVMINGQFVTLYSTNGQTWLSSPEDLPALMDRLENARITLNAGEKVAEGEGAKVAKPEQEPPAKEKEVPERILSTKYRMKGPKPRPILRQNGITIEGTPIEPISASASIMSFSSDVPAKQEEKKKEGKDKQGKRTAQTPQRIIAPVASKREKLVKAIKSAPSKKDVSKAKPATVKPRVAAASKAPVKTKAPTKTRKPVAKKQELANKKDVKAKGMTKKTGPKEKGARRVAVSHAKTSAKAKPVKQKKSPAKPKRSKR